MSDLARTVHVHSTHRAGRRLASEGNDRSVALAIVGSRATEREVRMFVEGIRIQGWDASAYDTGPGVIMLEGITPNEAADLVDGSDVVERVIVPDTRYRLARRDIVPDGSQVWIGGVPFGREYAAVIAGPCAVETEDQLLTIARACAAKGAAVLRGGAFKPRTSPYDFQGMGMLGVELLAKTREATGLPVVTEVMDPAMVEPMYPHVDAYQVGARSMQNFPLLKALGDVDKPVLLKRGFASTLEEWLLSAEYILAGGNGQVILCERGIRTFGHDTRFTLDLSLVALAKQRTHLPIVVDPSHATGQPSLIAPMARAALAAGADGLMIEVHNAPSQALSDGDQAIRPAALGELLDELDDLGDALGRTLVRGPLMLAAASS